MKTSLEFLVLLSFATLFSGITVAAQEQAQQNDSIKVGTSRDSKIICTSFNSESKTFGFMGADYDQPGAWNCPKNHALISTRRAFGKVTSASSVPLSGNCCPVPNDLLTEVHVYASEKCPANSVVTGGMHEFDHLKECEHLSLLECKLLWQSRTNKMRCTKINTQKYQLSAPKKMLILGWQPHFRTLLEEKTSIEKLPLSIRYGVGRSAKRKMAREVCIGYPWGSLVVAKSTKYCSGFYSSELVYADHLDNSLSGKPVNYLADCIKIENPFSEDAKCIGWNSN